MADRFAAELAALQTEAKGIEARVLGMVAENEANKERGFQIMYCQDAFEEQVRTLEHIASRMRALV